MNKIICTCGKLMDSETVCNINQNRCRSCGLVFLKHSDFILAMETIRRNFDLADVDKMDTVCSNRRGVLKNQKSEFKYLNCPVCKKQMNRKSLFGFSGIIVNECKDDGMIGPSQWVEDFIGLIAAGGDILIARNQTKLAEDELVSKDRDLGRAQYENSILRRQGAE